MIIPSDHEKLFGLSIPPFIKIRPGTDPFAFRFIVSDGDWHYGMMILWRNKHKRDCDPLHVMRAIGQCCAALRRRAIQRGEQGSAELWRQQAQSYFASAQQDSP